MPMQPVTNVIGPSVVLHCKWVASSLRHKWTHQFRDV